MKENWIVQEGNMCRGGIPDEIIVNNYFSTNKVMEFCWYGKSDKQSLTGGYSIGKWIIKTKNK